MTIAKQIELREWLEVKPRDWAQIIAVRAAMRALPFIHRAPAQWLGDFADRPILAVAMSWAARNVPARDMADADRAAAAAAAADAVRIAASEAGAADAFAASRPAFAAAHAAARAAAADADDAVYVADAAAYVAEAAAAARALSWSAVSDDCDWLDRHAVERNATRILSRRSLWLGQRPDWWRAEQLQFERALRGLDQSYAVWIDWFERRVRGERAAFDIPGDRYRKEDKAILIRLAEARDEDFWDQGAAYVNATLQQWIEEARERVAKHAADASEAPDRDAIAKALEEQASPEARIVDGKLDAGPNRRFDEPRYSGDLAELPSIQIATISAVLDCLPPNAAAVVKRCLAGYRDELIVRGNRPIVNILKAMGSAIRAEIFDDSAFDSPDEPEQWVMRDAREWDAGTGDLFRSFFRFHLVLLAHFPLDPEREALIAATPIDEAAAMGPALTEPVDAVADLILALADKGFATDNIVRIIEAHRLHNRDIAQLPPAEAAAGEVTPKRRHVLATLGFYLQTYSVLGSTASLAPYAGQLLDALQAAAQGLLRMIR
jgi:hypothetical protein